MILKADDTLNRCEYLAFLDPLSASNSESCHRQRVKRHLGLSILAHAFCNALIWNLKFAHPRGGPEAETISGVSVIRSRNHAAAIAIR